MHCSKLTKILFLFSLFIFHVLPHRIELLLIILLGKHFIVTFLFPCGKFIGKIKSMALENSRCCRKCKMMPSKLSERMIVWKSEISKVLRTNQHTTTQLPNYFGKLIIWPIANEMNELLLVVRRRSDNRELWFEVKYADWISQHVQVAHYTSYRWNERSIQLKCDYYCYVSFFSYVLIIKPSNITSKQSAHCMKLQSLSWLKWYGK